MTTLLPKLPQQQLKRREAARMIGGGKQASIDEPSQKITNVAASPDAALDVSLHIVHSVEGSLEVEGVLTVGESFDHTAAKNSAVIDKVVADFKPELETTSLNSIVSPDVSLAPVESAPNVELDAIKGNLSNNLLAETEKEIDDLDCDFSAVTEDCASSAVTEKICNLSSLKQGALRMRHPAIEEEELRHKDTSYTPSSGFVLRKYIGLPEISEDEVLIRVDASTISTRDCLERIRREDNDALFNDTWVPGHEIVGRVVKAGSSAESLLDRRVASLLPYGGGCARFVRVVWKDLIILPDEDFPSSSDDMVYLLSTYISAYQCLERAFPAGIDQTFCGGTALMLSQTKSALSGQHVLINGAGSPVGLALIDLAKSAGAIVYALSHSSFEKCIYQMGVKEWYPLFRKNEWKAEWRGKMDVIVDTIGDYDNYSSFYDVRASRGRFVRMNTTSCKKKFVPMQGEYTEDFFSVWEDLKGSSMNRMAIDYDIFDSFHEEREVFQKDLAYLHSLLVSGRIKGSVFSRVGFDELAEEWKKVMGGKANGAVVVSPWKD